MRSVSFLLFFGSLLVGFFACKNQQGNAKDFEQHPKEDVTEPQEPFKGLPNKNKLVRGCWKIDSIQLSGKALYPELEAYIFKEKTVTYLKKEKNYIREDHVGSFNFNEDTLKIYIDNPSSGSHEQNWVLELNGKSLIMTGLYKNSRGETPVIFMTKASYEKLTSFQ